MAARTWTVDEIQLGEMAFWELPAEDKDAAFAVLRRESPVTFHHEAEFSPGFPMGPGFWSIVRHSDIKMVNRQVQRFSSASGITIIDQTPEMDELFGSMINSDPPRHTRLRMLIQKGFTPKAVAQLEHSVRERAQRLVAKAADTGGGDFVELFAAPFPLQIICDMLGIPPADERRVFELTNVILGPGDPDFNLDFEQFMRETKELYDYAVELARDRLENPRDDIATTLVHAEVDGERLSLEEFAKFTILLAAAGNETTRNAISHGMKMLTDHPDQRRVWMDDFAGIAPTAVDEIVRLASPVLHMRRRATEDTEIAGQPIKAGDKVVMWYYAANRDETEFADPLRFDVRRNGDQVGFGGGGPHFCLGANLARREMTVMFEELFRTLPDIEITAEPQMLRSNFIHGIKKMPCEFTPVAV